MSGFDDFLALQIGHVGRVGRVNPSNPILPPYSPIGPNPQLDRKTRPSRPSRPGDADPYAIAERLAIQQEGNEISDLPDKPALTLAEQAALVMDRCNGGIGLLVEDLRTVARNFALADYIEAGNAAPQPILVQTTPMPPDRGWNDIAGFEGMPDLTPAQHGAILHRLMNPPQESPAPATVTCGSCAEFEPGNTPLGIGLCSRTANGLPPVASRGYGACFPIAPRSCPDHKELT